MTMVEMSKRIQLQVRQPTCELCPLSGFVDDPADICLTASGSDKARVMVVTKMPDSKKYRDIMLRGLKEVGFKEEDLIFAGAVKCVSFDRNPGKKDIKTCSTNYLAREIDIVKPEWILALGNEALQATTGHSGITKWRGKVEVKNGISVFPTVSPAMVLRNPKYLKGWKADLAFFANQVYGREHTHAKPKIFKVRTKEGLQQVIERLKAATVVSYDLETVGFEEWKPESAMVTISMTIWNPDMSRAETYVVPLYHPESPFRRKWRRVVQLLGKYLSRVKVRVAHNGKFDDRWLRHFGVDVHCTFDTMLAAHLLDENREKGLKELARMLLGAPAWDISTKDLLTVELDVILQYNGYDTHWTYELYKVFKQQLLDQPRLARIFTKLMMPASQVLTDAEMRGIWVDEERLATNTKIAYDELYAVEEKLLEYVPEDIPDFIGKNKRTGGQVNFNASNFARWWLFEYLELPVLKRGKAKEDGRPGDPSMAEDVLLELKGEHPAVDLMLERSWWQKATSAFFDPYNELIDKDSRIHTTFKLHGTVTGRLSSGKEDEDKITAKVQRRGVNLQQVPRDQMVRGLFGAPPGWQFVEADFSQIELRVVAFLSRDSSMLGIYQRGEDIHTATASWVLGIPLSQVNKDARKKAKAVNFGFVYGMGAPKFVHTAFTKYDLRFSVGEAAEIRRQFFTNFAGLPKWHAKQRSLANKYKRVQSPLGRVRNLPDIDSADKGVKAEAERQAINSPVQSFASDLTQLSMVLIQKEFERQGIQGFIIGTVHDSLLFEIKEEWLPKALPIIKQTMETLPLRKKFGIDVDVPIVADISVGKHWGGAEELTDEQVYDFDIALLTN